jgi:dTMP kinase
MKKNYICYLLKIGKNVCKIFLIFSNEITENIENGYNLIIDRYAYSGTAYSVAKGLDFNWCVKADIGIPKPDIVFFLEIQPEDAAKRDGYGEELYENVNFQKLVQNSFNKLKEENWKVIKLIN